MRKFISYLMFAVAAAFFTGCIDVNVTPIEPQGPTTVNLQLRNADLVATRAITDDDQNNEDLIKSVQCFFSVTDSDVVVYATDLIAVNAQQTKTLEFQIPAEHLSTLFANTATACDVYVVANYGTKIEDNSIAAIKAKPITLGTGATQESFVMDGKASVSISGTTLSGTVNLARAAAKIVVKANIKTSITEGSVTWTPNIAGIQMSYLGSVNGSKISATAADADASTSVTYEQTTGVFTKDNENTTDAQYVGYQTVPFYSFPVAASANKGEIDMIIPWKMGNTDNVVEYKYQIPVDIALERNHVYLLEVNVEVLGNVEGAELTPSYVIVDWTENAITAGLSRPKYLVVDETEVVMNNVNSYSVGYASSDAVTAVITSIKKPVLTGNIAQYPDILNTDHGFTLSAEDGVLTLSHTLQNDNTQEAYDYVQYEVTVVISNESGFSETIVFVQNPAIYIVANLNSDYKGPNSNNNNSNKGYVFVNKGTTTNASYGGVHGLGAASNANPNMYIINTSALAAGMNYVIGDPRVATANNLSISTTAPSVTSSTQRSLQNYYPTESSSAAENIIAPSFRIASSYGVATQQNYSNMQKRCATYQEDGYPAGRWRIPTKAEVEYIVLLSAKGYIPRLFNDDEDSTVGDYWCASGVAYPKRNGTVDLDTGTSNGQHSVRCVYDDWYWGSEPALTGNAKSTFTWGDQAR